MNDREIISAFGELTAQADSARVEENIRCALNTRETACTRRPVRMAAVIAAVLVCVMLPVAAIGAVYRYRAQQSESGYNVLIEGQNEIVRFSAEKLAEIAACVPSFNETTNIYEEGRIFESYAELDEWLGGILLTSPMIGGKPNSENMWGGDIVLWATMHEGEVMSVSISSSNTVMDRGKVCNMNLSIPLYDMGDMSGWGSLGVDMLDSRTIRAVNGIEAELVTTDIGVTAYFMHGGVMYRLAITGDADEAAAVLTEIIGTMQ